MSQDMILKTNHSPSYINKDTLLGGAAGFIIGNLVAPGAGFLVGPILGGLGGIVGKNRLEAENREGKHVGEPTGWNKDTLIGGLIGAAVAASAAILTGLAGVAATVGAAGVASSVAPAVAVLSLVAMAAVFVGSPIAGAVIGSRIGVKRQTAELEEAKKQTIVEHLSKTVSPEVGKAVEYSMEHSKDWGKQVTEDRMLAAAQGHQPGHG